MSVLDRFFGDRKKPVSAQLIREKQSQAEADFEKAEEDLKAAQENYEASLLSADEGETEQAHARVTGAKIARDRGEALVGALREEFLATCENEAEDERKRAYQEALASRAKGVELLKRYPALAAEIAKILTDVAAIEIQIAAANRELPSGAEPIESPELTVRWSKSLPEEIISEKTADAGWHYIEGPDQGERVEEQRQSLCRPKSVGARVGTVPQVYRGNISANQSWVVARRKKRITKKLPPVSRFRDRITPMAGLINLPSLRYGEAAIWKPGGIGVLNSGSPGETGKEVLARSEELKAEADRGFVDPSLNNRFPDTSEQLIDEPELLEKAEEFARSREGVGE